MSPSEAALILGVSEERVRELQAEGSIPNPIPDDYFNVVIDFRAKLEQAMRRKVDRHKAQPDE